MDKRVEDVCVELENVATMVLAGTDRDLTLREWHGWNHAALTRHDLANVAADLARRLRALPATDLDPNVLEKLVSVPGKLKMLNQESVMRLFDGNGAQAVPAYMETIRWVEDLVRPLFQWCELLDSEMLPPKLARKLKSYNATIDQMIPDQEKLKRQLLTIEEATDAALSLPTDLQTLHEARQTIQSISKNCDAMSREVDGFWRNSKAVFEHIQTVEQKSDAIVERCEEAFRITTTKGLAGAFDQRATALNRSMLGWIALFILALVIGGVVGANRIDLLTKTLLTANVNWSVVTIEVFITVLSLGGPIWFSWIATKQIGHRFKLAEDYAYKASVAKAYEGYKKEAVRLDPKFELRLFSSALSRLEEAPLRFVEDANHGSPWHELFESDSFKDAISSVPNFRDKLLDFVQGVTVGSKSAEGITTAKGGTES